MPEPSAAKLHRQNQFPEYTSTARAPPWLLPHRAGHPWSPGVAAHNPGNTGGVHDGQGLLLRSDYLLPQRSHKRNGQQNAWYGYQALTDTHEDVIQNFKVAGIDNNDRTQDAGQQRHGAAYQKERLAP